MTQSTRTTDEAGIIRWKLPNGKLHREDGPAIEWPDGTKEWFKHNLLHREGEPSVIRPGGEEWHINGNLHRDGGPAIIRPDRAMIWYQHGRIHREDGPAIINPDGSERWFIEDTEIENPSQITTELESKYPEFCGLFFIQYVMDQ